MPDQRLAHIKEKGVEEARKFVWIFLYLSLLFGLFAVHKSLLLNEKHLLYHQGFAIINALVLAKIMLVADMFHIGESLKAKPLVYPIVFNSAVYSVILMVFHYIEEILVGVLRGKSAMESVPTVGGGSLESIFVVGLIIFVVLTPFFALREIGAVVGSGKLFELFFLRRGSYVPQA
jgi:hypothetical protein